MTAGGPIVIGVGNAFRRDDGAGPAVVALLHGRVPGTRLVVCDGEPTALIDLWSGAPLAVVVDALRVPDGGRIGLVRRLSAQHPAATATGIAASHAVGLGDAVALARALDRMPRSLLLYGVQVVDVRFGVGLSPAVEAAARRLADEIVDVVAAHAASPEVA